MLIFLDSVDLDAIEYYYNLGIIQGVTTNPTFQRRAGVSDDKQMVLEIRKRMPDGEIHLEATGANVDEMFDNAVKLSDDTEDDELVFKIPFSEDGLRLTQRLLSVGIKTNLHLIYSVSQALLAATVKSTYICPLIGRLDDIGHDAVENLEIIKSSFMVNGEETKVMSSSIRHPQHVIKSYMVGVDAITIRPNILAQMFYHPLTDKGTETFKMDTEMLKPVSTRNINRNLVVKENDSLDYCLALMIANKGGAVAVSSDDGQLKGIFTAGDLKRLIGNKEEFDMKKSISEFMNKNPLAIDMNETVADAAQLMRDNDVDQLVVLDRDKVIGILDIKEVIF